MIELTNQEMLDKLNKEVYGHETAKKTLINLIRRSQTRYTQLWRDGAATSVSTNSCLLIGGSGTGKTFLAESIAKLFNIPVLMLNATEFRPDGSSTKGVDSFTRWFEKTVGDWARQFQKDNSVFFPSVEGLLCQTIVVIDETDKLAMSFESSGNWNNMIQAAMLRVLEGKGSLSGLSFVFCGAFAKLPDPTTTKTIGFNRDDSNEVIDDLERRLIEHGLLSELVGRVGNIIRLDNLSKEDYLVILNERLLPEINQEMRQMKYVPINISPEKRLDLVNKTTKNKLGVRGLKKYLKEFTTEHEFNATIDPDIIKKEADLNKDFDDLFNDEMNVPF